MSDETYSGWKNYPTWCVNLWLSNEEGLYNETLDIARMVCEEYAHPASEYWTVEQSKRYTLADQLSQYVDTLTRDDDAPATMAANLLGWALGSVDWHEIADAWIEQVED